MQKEDTARDKWAKILLRMKGNIPEICIRQPKYSQQGTEEIHTKASDRKKQKREQQRELLERQEWQERQKEEKRRKTATMNQKMKQEQIYRTCPTK